VKRQLPIAAGCVLQAALPYMRLNGGGRIVNISSIGGKVGGARTSSSPRSVRADAHRIDLQRVVQRTSSSGVQVVRDFLARETRRSRRAHPPQ